MVQVIKSFKVAPWIFLGRVHLYYDNRETPLAGNFVGRCQGHKSDISTQSWVLISEKDNVTISGGCLYTHEWRELVTGGKVRNGMEKNNGNNNLITIIMTEHAHASSMLW